MYKDFKQNVQLNQRKYMYVICDSFYFDLHIG